MANPLVEILSCIIGKLCEQNDSLPDGRLLTKFYAQRLPEISLRAYLKRIMTYFNCSSECFILALIYIDRLTQAHSGVFVSKWNVHRLLLCAVALAAKFFDDRYYSNAFYARVGGISTREMNSLEVDFLFLLNFNLSVAPADYKMYHEELDRHAARAVSCGCRSMRLPELVLLEVKQELEQCGCPGEGRVDSIETRMDRIDRWHEALRSVNPSMHLVDRFYHLRGSILDKDERFERYLARYGGTEETPRVGSKVRQPIVMQRSLSQTDEDMGSSKLERPLSQTSLEKEERGDPRRSTWGEGRAFKSASALENKEIDDVDMQLRPSMGCVDEPSIMDVEMSRGWGAEESASAGKGVRKPYNLHRRRSLSTCGEVPQWN